MYVHCVCSCRECCLAMVTGTCSDILPWRRFTAYGRTALRTRLGWQIFREFDILFLYKFSQAFMKYCFLSYCRYSCKGFSGRCREQRGAKSPSQRSPRFSVTGKKETNLDFSCSHSSSQFPLPCCSLSEGEISPSPECALVLEDEIGMCGYALALTDAKQAAAKIQVIKCNC